MEPMSRQRNDRPVPLSEVLRERVHSLGWELKFREMEAFRRWEEAVGTQIAQRARPSHVKNGRLTVIVDSPSWSQQLAFMKKELLKRFEDLLGEGVIRDLYFVTGEIESLPRRDEPSEPSEEPLDPETCRIIEEEASRIPDGDLRKAFRRTLLAASRRRQPPP